MQNTNLMQKEKKVTVCTHIWFYKIPQNSLPAVLLHMAGAFFIIPQSAAEYCGIAFSLLYCMGVLQNSTTVELWYEPFFCKTALIVGGLILLHPVHWLIVTAVT